MDGPQAVERLAEAGGEVLVREIGTELRNPDFAKFAESFGAEGIKLSDAAHVADALPEAIANDRPTVIEVPMDRLPSPF